VAQPVHEPAPIINLMDALKASLATAQGEKPPPKKTARSEGKKPRKSLVDRGSRFAKSVVACVTAFGESIWLAKQAENANPKIDDGLQKLMH
jgi:hypothetical protein